MKKKKEKRTNCIDKSSYCCMIVNKCMSWICLRQKIYIYIHIYILYLNKNILKTKMFDTKYCIIYIYEYKGPSNSYCSKNIYNKNMN